MLSKKLHTKKRTIVQGQEAADQQATQIYRVKRSGQVVYY